MDLNRKKHMGKIILNKDLAHYDSTTKSYKLLTGRDTESKPFVSNGYWLLLEDYLAPSTFSKYPKHPFFTEQFIRGHREEKDCKEFKLNPKYFTYREDLGKYEYLDKDVNIRVDKLLKEKIIDNLIENKVRIVYKRTKYITQFVYFYEGKKFIGLLVIEQDYVK